jgi:heptosyltransferase-2
VINLTGTTDLAEVSAMLAEADVMISNDMGLAHVSAAVGTPTVVIFGPTNPETTSPFSKNAHIVREQVDCSPCMLRDCPIDHRCMTRISVDRVFETVAHCLDTDDEEIDETAGYIS